MKIFNLPDLGEGLPDAEIVEWYVKPGDEIEQGQPLVSMETAKAIIDIPSPQSGRVNRLYGKEGDVIETGRPLVAFGEGEVVDTGTVVGKMESTEDVIPEQAVGVHHSASSVKATPAVRALANRMDVELSMVTPSGHDGLILVDDVRRVARILAEHGKMEPLRGVRRAMARNMAQAHAEVAPATIVDDADISHLQSRADITPALIQALVAGCRAEPSLNAWYDSHANGRRVLERIHLGLAVDAPQGLFVAVMQDIQEDDQEGVVERLVALKEKIKNRSLKPAELRGNSITLSNYGAIGGRYAAPMVLPPTVAILGAGESRDEVVARDGQAVIRHMLPLALTFDHRAVTGGEAARFLKAVIKDLQQ
ncbi:MAG: 2-oxo acid dehydrogenase subunit E2 [Proteobacteria bacterium]|nr:2-oxo acid dehydrogenase subunit E2 [Pseudomonadota bacterium]MCH8177732.1 2-oxo acid dehydrogenase subunit E2 [Pseudomonadota bacterium]